MKKLLVVLYFIFELISLPVFSQNATFSVAASQESALLPVPQKVFLSGEHAVMDDRWTVEIGGNLSLSDPAVFSLTTQLKERFGLRLTGQGLRSSRRIRLTVNPGSVAIGLTTDTNRVELMKQAYRLNLDPENISIIANEPQGLFYGVQTLVQIIQQDKGQLTYAVGEIVDWPDLNLRIIYWDDAHHLERLDAIKRAIRQASYYKINAFALKLEGHFQFESAKSIVEPYAYTPAEYQELTDYAKAHYVELIPYLDAPAHISFILKHPEYAGLRAFPNSNYELNVLSPEADTLILGMFENLIEANKGGKYILFSTDEAYYVGKNENEKRRAEALGGEGRLLAEYITRIGNQLHQKGRTVIIWAEYPLTSPDISSLPSHIVDGVYNEEWASKIKEHGMHQLIYTSTQGVEPHFPTYYPMTSPLVFGKDSLDLTDDEQQQGDITEGRVGSMLKDIKSSIAGGQSDFMGVIIAAWGDAGLNPETFWLGYATGSAAGWNSKSVTAQDLTTRFYHSFYGNKAIQMDRVYHLLSAQAEFWTKSWDWKLSEGRSPIIGNSFGIFEVPEQVKDQTLSLLPLVSPVDLSPDKDWNRENKERLQAIEGFLKDNNELLRLLDENITHVDYQHYNLMVFRSVALLCRQNLDMFLDFKRINDLLVHSSKVASDHPETAIFLIDQAVDQAQKMMDERNSVLQELTAIWYQDWFPRVAEANGRKYLDQVDDVKDHSPLRTVDMGYLIYRHLKYPLADWAKKVVEARNQFANRNHLPVKEIPDWIADRGRYAN